MGLIPTRLLSWGSGSRKKITHAMKAFGKLIAGNNMRQLIENKTTVELWVKMRRDAHATFEHTASSHFAAIA